MNINLRFPAMTIKTIPPNAKYIVMSDCHRGDEVCTAEGCRTYPLAITRTILETG
jgi:3-dehydroquinate synthase class II